MNTIASYLLNPGTVVSLNGEWGSGKTYSWYNEERSNVTIRTQLEKAGKKTIYISLFGKCCVSELKKEILNKAIETKGNLFHLIMISVLIFFLTAIMSIFAFQIVPNPDVRIWVLLGSVLVAGITVGKFYYHILKFFAQKTLGFDHNNIDFSTILNSEKIVFCFDDLERLSKNANLEEFLGFFELLSSQKFSILLIYNSSCQIKQHVDRWKEFKEKVIRISLQHKKEGVIDVLLDDDKLTDFEKCFVNSIYKSLQKAKSNLDSYIETDRVHINNLASNFRFYKKLIETFKQIKSITNSYKDLDENTLGNMLMYITVICIHNELEIPLPNAPAKENLYDFLYGTDLLPGNRDQLKHLGNALRFNQWYGLMEFPTIYSFLMNGDFNYESFSKEHTAIFQSELEKYVLMLKHWLCYRTQEQRKIVDKIEAFLCDNNEEFSSLDNMRQVLTKYSVFCSYIGKDLAENEPKCLSQKINSFIDNHEIPLELLAEPMPLGIFLHTTPGEEEVFVRNKNFINTIFAKKLLDYWLNKITSITDIENTIKNILIGDFSYYDQLFLYVLFNDEKKQQQIFRLRDANYSKWQDIIGYLKKRILEYNENDGFIKHVREVLQDRRASKQLFEAALMANVRELERLPGVGLSEAYTVRNFIG